MISLYKRKKKKALPAINFNHLIFCSWKHTHEQETIPQLFPLQRVFFKLFKWDLQAGWPILFMCFKFMNMLRFLQWNYSDLTFSVYCQMNFVRSEEAIGYLKILEEIVHVLHIFVALYFIPRDWLLNQDKASIPYKLYILLHGEITGLLFLRAVLKFTL